jgi:polysaccharide pyruvyl transferase WcaK-like protein
MRILHSYCLNYNIGDYALGIGLKNLLRKYLNVSLIGETNLQGRYFDKYYIEEVVNKKYDLLVIGGGGIIHGSHWPNGWFWLIDKDLIKEIKIPFIVYGAGYNYWREEGGIPERGVEHLRETIGRAASFSVRNDGSASRFYDDIGIKVPVVPDPGFHVDIDSIYHRYIDEPYVMIQLADDKAEMRYGSMEGRSRFIKQMREIVSVLATNYKVIFAPHVFDDLAISKEVSEGIVNTEIWNFGYFAFDHCYEAIAYYKYAEFAIAMRGHGQIIPVCFNTPVISLENHPKHRGLMETLGLLDYNVLISDTDFVCKIENRIAAFNDNLQSLTGDMALITNRLEKETGLAFELISKSIY